MKKQYIIPSITSVSFQTASICTPAVGSVQGNVGLKFLEEGDADPI